MLIRLRRVRSANVFSVNGNMFHRPDGKLSCFWFSIGKLQLIVAGIN